MTLSTQEEEILKSIRALNAFERVEIMKDVNGKVAEYIIVRSSKVKIKLDGKLNPIKLSTKVFESLT